MSMFRTILPAVVLALPLPAHAQHPDAITAPVDAIFAQWDSTSSAGCAVGVARDGRTSIPMRSIAAASRCASATPAALRSSWGGGLAA